MNNIEIPSIHDEFMQAFRALDYDKMDMLHDNVKAVYKDLFERLIAGDIDGFYYESKPGVNGHNMYIYTRSVKSDGVQKSVIWNCNGEDIPLSDRQYRNFSDLENDGCSDGVVLHWYKLDEVVGNN